MNPFNRLLLVTSDADFERSFTDAFGTAFDITLAPSAKEALGHLGARFYPILFADYALPDNHGVWLLGEARRLMPPTRRVLFSARAVPGLLELRAEGLVELFFAKPFDQKRYGPYLLPRERP